MQGLAEELGVSRVTLFRHVGGREALLGQALWVLTERTLATAAARWEAERPQGELHTPGTGRHINALVSQSKGLRRLLDDEPALALRVLTDPRGRVQTGIVTFIEDCYAGTWPSSAWSRSSSRTRWRTRWCGWASRSSTRTYWPRGKPDVATADRLQQALVEGTGSWRQN